MTKTEYKTVVSYTKNGPVYRCVYQDGDGKLYVKVNGSFKCIDNAPCAQMTFNA